MLGRIRVLRAAVVVLIAALPNCSIDLDLNGPFFTTPTVSCDAPATAFRWGIGGFRSEDVLKPVDVNQTDLTATLPVGQRKGLWAEEQIEINARSLCTSKIRAVEWTSTNPEVAKLEPGTGTYSAWLVGVAPGEATISAALTFWDGSPPIRALPTLVLSYGPTVWGNITVVRVVPSP